MTIKKRLLLLISVADLIKRVTCVDQKLEKINERLASLEINVNKVENNTEELEEKWKEVFSKALQDEFDEHKQGR